MANVYLYGSLADKFAPKYSIAVDSPRSAVKFLMTVVPGFRHEFMSNNYYINVGSLEDTLHIDETSLDLKTHRDIHIIPEMTGAKNGGVGKILMAAAIAVTAFYLPGVGVLAEAELGTSIVSSAALLAAQSALYSVSILLALKGASALLTPSLKQNSDKGSGTFSGDPSTAQQGTPVPLLYGEMYCDLGAISASIVGETSDRTQNNTINNYVATGVTNNSSYSPTVYPPSPTTDPTYYATGLNPSYVTSNNWKLGSQDIENIDLSAE